MIFLGGYDEFDVRNGHAIIGDWIAYSDNDELHFGKITGLHQIGVYEKSGLPRDRMVINDGEIEIPDTGVGENRYDVVRIAPPCELSCCAKEGKS